MNSQAAAELASKHLRREWEVLTERERQVLHVVAERVHISRPIHRKTQEGLSLGQRVPLLLPRHSPGATLRASIENLVV